MPESPLSKTDLRCDTGEGLLACPECDLLHRRMALAAGRSSVCQRCGAVLERTPQAGEAERLTAYLLAALILFVLAHAFPILGLEIQGQRNDARLLDAVGLIHAEGMSGVATLLLLFTLVMPLIHVGGLLAVLVPGLLGRMPSHQAGILRLVGLAAPWSMVEVLILGVLVSLVKLAKLAVILPGVALGAFAGYIVLTALATSRLRVTDLWRVHRP
jgi:paraquat-inducible protein A